MPLQEVHTGFTFNFDGSKFAAIQRGVNRASTNLNTIAAKTEVFTQRMGGFLQRARQVVGVYLGFRAVRLITTDYAAGADAIAKYSSGLGLNAQAYQRLTHAAQLNGVTVAELNVALPNLAKNAGEAADGSKSMQLAFQRANVSIKDSAGKLKDPITLMTDMADGLDSIKDKGRKTQILMNLFGRSGKKMGVLLAQGSEGIKKAMMEADKLGLVLSDKQLKAGEKFTDEMLRVKAVLTGVRNTIASRLLPALSNMLEKFRKWWVEGKNAERALRALKLVAIFTGIVIARLIGASVLKQVSLFVKGIWAGVQALRAMGIAGAITALKVWAIVAAFAFVVLAIEDLIGFAQGKDSVIGRLLGDSQLGKDLKESLLSLWRDVKKAWDDIKPALLDAWEALKPVLADLGNALKPLIGPAVKGAVHALIASIEMLSTWIQIGTAQIGMMKTVFNGVVDSVKSLLRWMGVDPTKAWRVAFATLMTPINALMWSLKKLIELKNLAFGIVTKAKTGASAAGAGILDQFIPRTTASPSGAPVMTGLFQPSPAAAFAGGAGNVQTTVSEGAVKLTVNATGDAQQIALAVNTQVIKGLNKVITDASRDIKRPPRGQR